MRHLLGRQFAMWSAASRFKSNLVILIFLISLIKLVLFAQIGAKMLTDDGQNFTGAVRFLAGERPYIDYQNFFPPTSDIFTSAALKSTNFSIGLTRGMYAVVAAGLFPLVYVLSRRLSDVSTSLLITTLVLFVDVRADLLFFNTLFLASFWWTCRGKFKRAGLALALGSLWRWEFAAAWFIAEAVVLLIKKTPRNIAKISIFPSIINAVVVGWLYKSDLVGWYWKHLQAGILAKGVYSINWLSQENLFSLPTSLENLYSWVIGWLYIIGLIILGKWLFQIRKSLITNPLLVGLLTQVALSVVYLHNQIDLGHVAKGGIVLFILLAAAFQKRILFMGLACLFLITQIALSVWQAHLNSISISFPVGGSLRLPSQYIEGTTIASAGMLIKAVAFLRQANPDEPVFVAPYLSLLYFLSDRKNPTIYDNLLSGYLIPDKGEDYVIRSIDKVRYIVYDNTNGPNHISMPTYYPKIDQYITENYAVIDKAGPWLLMKKLQTK